VTTIPFPVKQQPLDLPAPRIWKLEDLMGFLRVSKPWVYKHTTPRCEDPIPRIPGIGRLRFDTWNPQFQDWMARHLGHEEKE
jgi:hypothetical protein